MSVSSMTGFARADGACGDVTWHWEVKSVNGRGLDMRLRLPPGYEALELPAREAVARHCKRGNLQVTLAVREPLGANLKVNEAVLERVVEISETLRARLGAEPVRIEGLLALRGVLEVAEPEPDEAAAATRNAAMLKSFEAALLSLSEARKAEGARLKTVIEGQLQRIEALTASARACPERAPEAIRQKLAADIARILEAIPSLDPDRLHQEAVFLAQRADIQEELDRLDAHVSAGRDLLVDKEPAGRRFDFLAQEFNREANTLCSKSSGRELTRMGLELKTVIDQLREQVQNLE
ncbi:MAG: YicC/YloC family endoribonuclease [Parvibaculaceae bacterium]